MKTNFYVLFYKYLLHLGLFPFSVHFLCILQGSFIFLQMDFQLSNSSFCEKIIVSPLHCLGTLDKIAIGHKCKTLSSISPIYVYPMEVLKIRCKKKRVRRKKKCILLCLPRWLSLVMLFFLHVDLSYHLVFSFQPEPLPSVGEQVC